MNSTYKINRILRDGYKIQPWGNNIRVDKKGSLKHTGSLNKIFKEIYNYK